MSLFQKSVEKKYLQGIDAALMGKKYADFQDYFGNPERQANIRNSKEEQFQEGFLRELFVKIFDYTLYPEPDFNLTTELKNVSDNKKTDGAILRTTERTPSGDVLAVIELKSTSTTDLDSIESQAFGYKHHHPNCVYVITSNFEKLRFYIQNAVDHIDFDLFNLNREQFALMWLCLAKDNLMNDLPLKIKESSVLREENITKKLYADYSKFREATYHNLVKNNPDTDKLLLLKKTQKLLDRFLFIFFAEDKLLVPPNSINQIIEKWKDDVDFGDDKTLYSIFKQYFHVLNVGRPKSGKHQEIFAYNGGLFQPDEILDNVSIDDDILHEHTLKLSNYNFETDVDVNILGHIFEHSLGEIENVQAEIKGEKVDILKTKRKKEAWHITTATYNSRYSQRMFDNYVKVGEPVWLSEKEEIIVTETIAGIAENDKLNILAYNICRDHMHIILVCEEDEVPKIVQKIKSMSARACNIAMGRTIPVSVKGEHAPHTAKEIPAETAEHAPPSSASMSSPEREHAPEKRGGTQAHLWTQRFGQKKITSEEQLWNTITYVRNNRVKHGLDDSDCNQVITPIVDKESAKDISPTNNNSATITEKENNIGKGKKTLGKGEKALTDIIGRMTCTTKHAFRTQYKGGFDVVIGNPPYIHLEKIHNTSIALEKANYETFDKRGDIYCVFVEKGFDILKSNGLISYIMPNKWLQAGYGTSLREYLLKHKMIELIDFGDIQIFEGATTYPCIFISQKAIVEKLKAKYETLSDYIGGQAYRGVLTGLTDAFLIDEKTRNRLVKEDPNTKELIKPFLQGRDLSKYCTVVPSSYLILFEKGITNQNIENESEAPDWIRSTYPSIANWLSPFEEKGQKRTDKGDYWWELRACDYYEKFARLKIMYQALQVKPCFIFDDQGLFCNNSMWIIPTENKALLGILNSKMGWWLITKYCTQIQNGYQLIWRYLGLIPIPNFDGAELSGSVELMIELNRKLGTILKTFLKYIDSQFTIEKFSKKLENWGELEFSEFNKELSKVTKRSGIQKLSKTDEMEWMEVFESKKEEVKEIKSKIEETDKEIDQLVYNLYDLTGEEIKIVEGAIK